METHDFALQLHAHLDWADAMVWRTVLDSEAARADAELKERLHHIHLVQHAFLSLWRGEGFDPNAGADLDLEALIVWGREGIAEARAHLAGLGETDLDQDLPMPWAAHVTEPLGVEPAMTTMRDTVYQVAAHTQHHRGQVTSRLRQLGVAPPLIDFIAWVWLARPDADWP